MISAILSAAALLLLQAAPNAAAASAPAPAAAASAPGAPVSPVTVTGKKDPNLAAKEVVCHKEPVMGTLFPREVCARRDEIAERRRVDQATTRETQALRPWRDPSS
jgi:hypothetical protein